MKKIILHSICFFFLALSSMQAQQDVTLTADNITANAGDVLSIEVKVENWVDVVSAQWTMHWDDQILQYQSISNFALPAASIEENFGAPPVTDDNTLTFSWYDASVVGFSVNDNEVLFTINFQVIGSGGDNTAITFDGTPTVIEVMNNQNVILDVNFSGGEIEVAGSSSIAPIQTSDFTLYSNSPNPFKDFTNIVFDLHKRSKTHLSIYNTTGQLVFEKKYDLGSGSQSILIDKSILSTAGTYLYRISTDEATATRKMTLIY